MVRAYRVGPGGCWGDIAICTALLWGQGAVGCVHSFCCAVVKEYCRAWREFGYFIELWTQLQHLWGKEGIRAVKGQWKANPFPRDAPIRTTACTATSSAARACLPGAATLWEADAHPSTVIPDRKHPFCWHPHTRHHRKLETLYRGGNHTPKPPRHGGVALHMCSQHLLKEEAKQAPCSSSRRAWPNGPLCRAASLSLKESRTHVQELPHMAKEHFARGSLLLAAHQLISYSSAVLSQGPWKHRCYSYSCWKNFQQSFFLAENCISAK